jgi:phosphonate transport system substrate-binding protein
MKLFKYVIYLLPVTLFIIISSNRELNEGELGTRTNPIKIYFTPSVDAKRIATNARDLVNFLEEETGYYFTTALPSKFYSCS